MEGDSGVDTNESGKFFFKLHTKCNKNCKLVFEYLLKVSQTSFTFKKDYRKNTINLINGLYGLLLFKVINF